MLAFCRGFRAAARASDSVTWLEQQHLEWDGGGKDNFSLLNMGDSVTPPGALGSGLTEGGWGGGVEQGQEQEQEDFLQQH